MRFLHRQTKLVGTLYIAGALVLFLFPVLVSAQPEWDANRGNCEDVLQQPQNYELAEVRFCAQTWESYRDPQHLTRDESLVYARGFSRLYYEGTDGDRRLSQSALARLGVDVLERGDFLPTGSSRARVHVQRDTTPIEVGRSSSRARRQARSRNADGMEAYGDGDYAEAARQFESALAADPWHVLAKYNLACQYSLLGRVDDSVRHLDELSRWNIPEADERMARARVDEDFAPMRDDPRFREITGYVRAQLLNGAGSAGLGPVETIRGQMTGAQMDVASYGNDRHLRLRPWIYYRAGYEDEARGLNRLLALDGANVELITWSTDYDIVVLYGNIEAATANPLRRPLVQGTWDGTIVGGDPEEAAEEAAGAAEEAAGAVQEWVPPAE